MLKLYFNRDEQTEPQNKKDNNITNGNGAPGFEIIFLIIEIALFLFIKRKTGH